MVSPTPDARATLMVPQSAAILKRFYFLQRELVLLQAGWLPGVADWETKLLLPELMWQDAIFARELRLRILELRFPERRIAVSDEAPLLAFVRACSHAPNALGFALVLGDVLKPLLLAAYRAYAGVADELDDGPTQFLLRHGLTDLEQQIERLRSTATEALKHFPADAGVARGWHAAVAAAFADLRAESLLVTNLPAPPSPAPFATLSPPFAIARHAVRDPRFRLAKFAWPDRHTPGHAGEGNQLRARQAVHHVNEVWAAEMIAACLHDLGAAAPPEFLEDAARWCYDEIRHCRMGYERLKSWGFADRDIPLDTFSYDAGASLDPIGRLGILFYFEATYIHTKSERTTLFADIGDRLSSHDMDFDWADELLHTHYGKRWLAEFLARDPAARKLTDISEAARTAVFQQLALVTEPDKQLAAEISQRLVSRLRDVAPEVAAR